MQCLKFRRLLIMLSASIAMGQYLLSTTVSYGAVTNQNPAELIEALKDSPSGLDASTLRSIVTFIKQGSISKPTLKQTVLPAVRTFQRRAKLSADAEALELVQQALWHIQVQEIANERDRIAFLRTQVVNWDSGYYYPFETVDYLVAAGTEEAREVIEQTIAEDRESQVKLRIDGKLVERLEVGLEEIDLRRQLAILSPIDQVEPLMKAYEKNQSIHGFSRYKFTKWLIFSLEKIPHSEATVALQAIWKSSANDIDYREAAQEALLKRGDITPKEKLILSVY